VDGGFPNMDAMKAANQGLVERLIAEFNERFMVVNEGGKATIYAPAEDLILHRRYFDRLGFSDLRALYLNRKIEAGRDDKDNPIMRPVADIWLHHPERRQFIRDIGVKSLSLIDSESYASQNDRKDAGSQNEQGKFPPNCKISKDRALTCHGFLPPHVEPGSTTVIRF